MFSSHLKLDLQDELGALGKVSFEALGVACGNSNEIRLQATGGGGPEHNGLERMLQTHCHSRGPQILGHAFDQRFDPRMVLSVL